MIVRGNKVQNQTIIYNSKNVMIQFFGVKDARGPTKVQGPN